MQGLVNSAALAGSLCGSLVLGRLADRIGRRAIFQYAILWYALFTALTAFAWGPWSVMTFRFLAGLGLGGMLVVDPSMLAEYLPPQRRGRLLVFLDFWWPVGLLLATGLSYVFLGHFDRSATGAGATSSSRRPSRRSSSSSCAARCPRARTSSPARAARGRPPRC